MHGPYALDILDADHGLDRIVAAQEGGEEREEDQRAKDDHAQDRRAAPEQR